jgi:Domain of unknown function (DUF3846)
MKVLHIPADGSAALVDVDSSDMTAIQALVGGMIEPIRFVGGLICVNEDGLMLQLPYNSRAAVFAGVLGHPVPLVGDVFIAGARFGEDVQPFVINAAKRWVLLPSA